MSSSTTEKPAVQPEDTPDLDVILPSSTAVIVDGVECEVRRLKTREFLGLMKVLTSGLGPALSEVRIDFADGESVARDLSALMLLALPNAFVEFTLFLTTIVEPKNDADKVKVVRYLGDNPEIDVLIDVFEAVARQEKDDLAALAGKAQAMWSRVAPLYSSPGISRN